MGGTMGLTARRSMARWLRQGGRSPAAPNPPTANPPNLIPGWIWTIFIASLLLFLVTLYITSWTSTGPTFFPVELSNPFQAPLSPLEPTRLDGGQRYLPDFLQLPADARGILIPFAVVASLCVLLPFVPSNNWTRLIVKSLIIALGMRYLVWRTFGQTLNWATPTSSMLSLWMYLVEVYGVCVVSLSSVQTIWSNAGKRHAEADRYEQQVRAGEYVPWVDVLVPTYNEQPFIIRRTVMGCQAMDYPNKRIYICDDARRPQIRALAAELGCEYITQPEGFINRHAKAGNMNNALSQTHGELVVIFDADFVPFRNFLMRTVGFFQQPDLALLQTPQHFYNPDYHVRNLGLEQVYPNDLQQFFRHEQTLKDAAGVAMCCGTSFILRRSALDEIGGGFYKRCIPEDSSTSLVLLTRGFRVAYLNEILSMGESPRNHKDFIKQRLRWLQGNMQIFLRVRDIPLWTTPHLNWFQKSYFLNWLLCCFGPFLRATMYILPLLCLYLGVSNYVGSYTEFFYYAAPYILLMMGTMGWASHGHVSHFYNEIYETILCFPSVRAILSTLRSPFKASFKVTAKGVTANQKNYNLEFTYPLLIVIGLTLVMLALQLSGRRMGIWTAIQSEEFGLLFFWMSYNLVWMMLAVLAAIDQPERRQMDRFPLQTACKLSWPGGDAWGHTQNLSETGARVNLLTTHWIPVGETATLELLEHQVQIPVTVVSDRPDAQSTTLSLQFQTVSADQHRQLVSLLYGEMAWWKQNRRPGAIDTLLAMAGSFLKLRPVRSVYR
jgi:cellulose synthase (UDP-forming)